MKKVLNVGGGSREVPIPQEYAGFEHLLLDIDPKFKPDILCDARELAHFEAAQFDAVYRSHNLEHYYRHDVVKVLAGFMHVLKDDGFAHIIVPNIAEVMRVTVENGLDVDDVLYESPVGPIRVLDVMYGFGREIEQSGQDFYAHKTGFTPKVLGKALARAGFRKQFACAGGLEIAVLAFKVPPDHDTRALFKLPPE
jgi:SAM-dependent methyltransferase